MNILATLLDFDSGKFEQRFERHKSIDHIKAIVFTVMHLFVVMTLHLCLIEFLAMKYSL